MDSKRHWQEPTRRPAPALENKGRRPNTFEDTPPGGQRGNGASYPPKGTVSLDAPKVEAQEMTPKEIALDLSIVVAGIILAELIMQQIRPAGGCQCSGLLRGA